MQIHLSPRHVKLTAAIHQHAAGIIAQVEDLAEIEAAHVVLMHDEAAKPDQRYCAKVHLAVRGPDIHGEAHAENIHSALDAVVGKLARQLRKRKTKMKDKRRSIAQRTKESSRRS